MAGATIAVAFGVGVLVGRMPSVQSDPLDRTVKRYNAGCRRLASLLDDFDRCGRSATTPGDVDRCIHQWKRPVQALAREAVSLSRRIEADDQYSARYARGASLGEVNEYPWVSEATGGRRLAYIEPLR